MESARQIHAAFAPASSAPSAIVERALAIHGAAIYVRHEVVHNSTWSKNLKSKGAVFVEALTEVPVRQAP